ncbi:hypothetical protein JW930_07335 [Candidatus Woesearchaeota archaeon]|nr:hypothetical protein [Candidatus Woesearchaeota archaeon]
MKKVLIILLSLLLIAGVSAIDPDIDLPASFTINEGEDLLFNLTDYAVLAEAKENYNLSYWVNGSGYDQAITGDIFHFISAAGDAGQYPFTITIYNYSNQGGDDTFTVIVQALGGISVTSAKLGDENQDRGLTISSTFVVTNTRSETITGISISSDANSKYSIAFANVPSSLASGQQATVTVTGYVPLDFDAVDIDGKKVAYKIGNIIVNANGGFSTSADLIMEAENKLEFQKFYVVVNGDEDRVDDGDEVDELSPGDDIEIRAIVENRFDDSGKCSTDGTNCEIYDIEATIEIDEDDWDVDEDLDFSDLDAEDDDEDSVSFSVDKDADDRTFTMYVQLTGDDENGARHGEYWEIDMTVERERHEILIEEYSARPNTLECDERDFRVTVTIENTGQRDEDQVTLDIENERLGILDSIPRIELDEGDSTTEYFEVSLPWDTEPGTYYFDIIAYYDNDEETDRVSLKISVEECQTTTTLPYVTTTLKVIDYPPGSGVYYGQPIQKQGFMESKEYILLLIVAIVIVLMLILVLVAVLVRK